MAGFCLAIAAACLAFGFIRRASSALTITNQRVMAQKGFWTRKTFEEESLLGRTSVWNVWIDQSYLRRASRSTRQLLIKDRE